MFDVRLYFSVTCTYIMNNDMNDGWMISTYFECRWTIGFLSAWCMSAYSARFVLLYVSNPNQCLLKLCDWTICFRWQQIILSDIECIWILLRTFPFIYRRKDLFKLFFILGTSDRWHSLIMNKWKIGCKEWINCNFRSPWTITARVNQ